MGAAISTAVTATFVTQRHTSNDIFLVIDHSSVVAGSHRDTHIVAFTVVRRAVYNTYCGRYNKLSARTTENRALRLSGAERGKQPG
jgi:hypothetical protein